MKNRLFKKLFFTIAGWSLISGVIGGFLSFVLVNRNVAEKDKANIRYFNEAINNLLFQNELIKKQLSDNTSAILNKQKTDESKTIITDKIKNDKLKDKDIVEEIRPGVKVKSFNFFRIAHNTYIIPYQVENIGKYTVILEKPQIDFSRSNIERDDTIIKNKLIINKDYSLDNLQYGAYRTKDNYPYSITVKFNDNIDISNLIYFRVKFKMKTDDVIVDTVKKSVKSISKDKIDERATFNIIFTGKIDLNK